MATATTNPALAPPLSTRGRLNGILFVALFALAVTQLAGTPSRRALPYRAPATMPTISGLMPRLAMAGRAASWAAGINFSARGLLRIAVAFFGLRVSLQEIAEVGWSGLTVSLLVVTSTLLIGLWCGTRLFKLDRDTALLTAAGSAICGAAAVLAFESALRSA
ncbi:putative sulfate exporter family transporter, partial [Pseudomonas putida]|nr:putative sulfate exporter family transporter [Pseudomonas putida]